MLRRTCLLLSLPLAVVPAVFARQTTEYATIDAKAAAQIAALKEVSQTGKPEVTALHGNQLTLTVPEKGLALVEIR
jgi:hypothetical protein